MWLHARDVATGLDHNIVTTAVDGHVIRLTGTGSRRGRNGCGLRIRSNFGTGWRLEGVRIVPVLQEFKAYLREQRIGENIVDLIAGDADSVLDSQPPEFVRQLVQLCTNQVRGAAGYRFSGVTKHPRLQFAVDGCRRSPILAPENAGSLLGDVLVALAGQHVQDGLRTDDL